MVDTGGRQLTLQALAGSATDRVPAGVLVWGFDYTWKVAGLEPWQLAAPSVEMVHKAHLAYYERHKPDFIWYHGTGSGPEEPRLIGENDTHWEFQDGNHGGCYLMDKTSLVVTERTTGRKTCDALATMKTREDIDRVVGEPGGMGAEYLAGLTRLIADIGDRALVIPYVCTAYIAACYSFGFERAMEYMLTEPELFVYACERYRINEDLRYRELAEAGAEAVLTADAWASMDIISPAAFERFALPYHQSAVDAARAAGVRSIIWNEGDVRPILGQEAATGMDAFYFEQSRKGVQLSVTAAREAFGHGRCLFGNLDSEALMGRNNPAEIRAAVQDQIRQSGRNEPFILSTGSPLPSETEPEAVDAAISAAREWEW